MSMGFQAASNQARIRERMRQIIADRQNRVVERANGECHGCGWKCKVNDRTCVVDYDEVYDPKTDDWGWGHWCLTHPKKNERKSKSCGRRDTGVANSVETGSLT